MSINSRIKERRESLNMSRIELAEKIGVTASAIANYENEISSPKIEVMYKIFDALKCDANYLYQDEIGSNYPLKVSYDEMQHIEKYRVLDEHGKEMVDFTLLKEWERSTALSEKKEQNIPMTVKEDVPDYLGPKAARNDYIDEDGETERIQNDLSMLKKNN